MHKPKLRLGLSPNLRHIKASAKVKVQVRFLLRRIEDSVGNVLIILQIHEENICFAKIFFF